MRFIDLANIDTVLGIETRDEGQLLPDGRLILHGRLPGAPARGCSLTVEEAMEAVGEAPGLRSVPVLPRSVGPVTEADRERVERLIRALVALPEPRVEWGQGIEQAQVGFELQETVARLSMASLLEEVSTVPAAHRPESMALVAAEGVFTAGLEWVVLAVAGGLAVHWKPPSGAQAFAHAVGSVLSSRGFPVTVDADRSLGSPDVVVVFGSDHTVRLVEEHHHTARVVGYGHRLGLAVVEGAPTREQVSRLLEDHLRFDTRGCMAPAGVLVVDGDVTSWMEALASEARSTTRDCGSVSAALGPELRRRLGLARATLGVVHAGRFVVLGALPEHFVPVALPWMATLVPVANRHALVALVKAHAHQVSVLARPASLATVLDGQVDRVCELGQMQAPPFPRHHDGQPMFARICGWAG
ncbi:MAG TPA: hypothetical protein DFR83_22010 [Deltaproteobacteria bacterium]|nr:hypothetical protein [Deltaproteobacteria bacterium]